MEIAKSFTIVLWAFLSCSIVALCCGCSAPLFCQERPDWKFAHSTAALSEHSPAVAALQVLDPSDDLLAAIAERPGVQALCIRFEQRNDARRFARLKGFKNLLTLQILDRQAMTEQVCKDLSEIKTIVSLDLDFAESSREANLDFLPSTLQQLRLKLHGLGRGDLSVLANLRALKSLDVSSCYFAIDDKALEHIAAMTFLQSLSFGFGPTVTEVGQKHVASMDALRSLCVLWPPFEKPGPLTDEWLTSLKCLPNLSHLEIRGSGMVLRDGSIWLRSCSSLKSLTIFGCTPTTVAAFGELANCKSLESLDVRNCREFKNVSVAACHGLPRFHSLKISSSFDDEEFDLITGCGHLQELDCLYSSAMGTQLTKLTKLRKIRIASRVEDACLTTLAELSNLREVLLFDCYDVTDAGVIALCKPGRLEVLELGIPALITDKIFDVLGQCQNLRSLTITGNQLLTGQNIGKCTELSELVIVNCTKFGDEFCRAFGTLPKLRTVWFERCPTLFKSAETLRAALPETMIVAR